MWSWTEPGAARFRRQCFRIVKGSGGDLAMRPRPQTAAAPFSGVSEAQPIAKVSETVRWIVAGTRHTWRVRNLP
ncbi:MAG: hypothetical protein QOH30_3074 [Baekduia sp.]|nr:hypothetical protein [Baekduia sp.]